MKRTFAIAMLAMLLSATTSGLAQTAVAPPPKPADSGPSLDVTMKFIQDKVSSNGSVTCTAILTDTSTGEESTSIKQGCGFVTTHVVADPAACTISFHRKYFRYDGSVRREGDYSLDLRKVEDISVMPIAQFWNRDGVQIQGVSCCTVTPEVYVVWPRPVDARYSRSGGEFHFYSEEMADRVAKALTHAVELCGGGNKEPF